MSDKDNILADIDLNDLIVEDNGPRNIAVGLTDFLYEATNEGSRKIITGSTTKDDLFKLINSYFEALDNIEDTYDRSQLIQDVILMVKRDSSAAAAKLLVELLNLDSAAETYEINSIDFSEVNIDDEFFKIK